MARPEKEPDEKTKQQVQTLSGYGLNQEQIATMLGMSRQTLAKWCELELKRGKVLAYSQAVGGLFNNIKKGKEASIFFYLKTQHGWREKSDYEIDTQGKTITISLAPDPQSDARKRNKLD